MKCTIYSRSLLGYTYEKELYISCGFIKYGICYSLYTLSAFQRVKIKVFC